MTAVSALGRGRDDANGQQNGVLVVDDDAAMRNMIANYLSEHGMHAVSIASGTEMAREVAAREPGLIILGLHVGQDNGLDLLRDLRSHSDVPVIVLTGRRYDESDWVVGLELGADDYLIKPFSLRELLARARAKLRRLDSSRDAMRSERKRDRAKFGDWQLDRRTRRLINGGGETVALTKGEWGLLLAFLESPQRPLTRGYLLQATRIHQDLVCRAIDVQVFRLRRKLEADPSSPRLIQTERGVGYVFASPVKWL